MTPELKNRLFLLFTKHGTDTLTPEEHKELQDQLRTDPEARRLWFVHQDVEAGLQTRAGILPHSNPPSLQHSNPTSRSRSTWGPVTAAAAGIVVGLFSASVAWAVGGTRAVATTERLAALVDGGFEEAVPAAGFPKESGGWSGDASEVVISEEKTRALEGLRMLRFVKTESDPNSRDGRAIACDVFQMVDLRPLRETLRSGGDSVLELSANFLDARPQNTKPSVTFFCQIFLFKGDAGSLYQTWPNNITEAIASGSAQVTTLGGHGEAWRQLTAKSLVSAEADFAVVQISARPNLRVEMPPQLFVDDVKLTLKTQPLLPVRVVQPKISSLQPDIP